MSREQITEAVARGWCTPTNESKVMDSDLALAIVDEIVALQEKELTETAGVS